MGLTLFAAEVFTQSGICKFCSNKSTTLPGSGKTASCLTKQTLLKQPINIDDTDNATSAYLSSCSSNS